MIGSAEATDAMRQLAMSHVIALPITIEVLTIEVRCCSTG
jgi:hypothetical protein